MRESEVKGTVAFVLFLILAVLFLSGFLLLAVVLIAVGLLVFIGFYIYLHLKLWWARRHPPKELEGPADYF